MATICEPLMMLFNHVFPGQAALTLRISCIGQKPSLSPTVYGRDSTGRASYYFRSVSSYGIPILYIPRMQGKRIKGERLGTDGRAFRLLCL